MKIKLRSIKFGENKFRKLQKIYINFSDRITVIGGLNGIGKSTILGLIANASGIRSATYKSYFNSVFQSNFQELFHLDEVDDYQEAIDKKAYIEIEYLIDSKPFIKKCSVSKHIDKDKDGKPFSRLKIVPRSVDKELGSSLGIGESQKVPLPTLYLGMSRMTPIGEYEKDRVTKTKIKTIDTSDKAYIFDLFSKVVNFDISLDEDTIIDHDFKGSKKRSKLPSLKHNTLSISLGQDSLSSIFTALASFKQIKRKMASDYPGGLLIIDEIDAGLHHVAQLKLIELLKKEARSLDLQIIFTTHSLTLFKNILNIPEEQVRFGNIVDSVVYLHNTPAPKIMNNPNYHWIKNNQLSQAPEIKETVSYPKIKVYLEDNEALFFLEKILSYGGINDTRRTLGIDLDMIPLKISCTHLMNLFNGDDYFKKVVIVPDNDILSEETNRRIVEENHQFCPLPGSKEFTVNTQSTDRNPEKILYNFLDKKVRFYNSEDPFWEKILQSNYGAYDYDYITNSVLCINDIDDVGNKLSKEREKMKYWLNKHKSFLENAKIIDLWAEENQNQVDSFLKNFKRSTAYVSQNFS